MLENQESLLPISPSGRKSRVLIAGEESDSLDELHQLLDTLGLEPVGRLMFSSRKIHPATYVGRGKLDELKERLEPEEIDAVIFDLELSPNQLRNIEKILTKPVLDRPGVIIEIFSRHARTKEAKTQVELARLQYLLPRLAHFWTHFERQRGGIGNKGMGESQIEVDRRLVKKRMAVLQKRLKEVENERSIQRGGRQEVLKVALVGYTNAGKSTLLNALTHSDVRAENKLFATLDPSVRTLDPHSHPPVVMIDTVGFIRKLPPALIASFRSTLEELNEADLLVHVVDVSAEHPREQLQVTEQIIKDLKLDHKPRMTVLNKIDRVDAGLGRNFARLVSPGAVTVSAIRKEEVDRLRELILDYFRKTLEVWELTVPYAESKLEAQLHAHGEIEVQRYLEKGTFYRIRIDKTWAGKLGLARFKTGQ